VIHLFRKGGPSNDEIANAVKLPILLDEYPGRGKQIMSEPDEKTRISGSVSSPFTFWPHFVPTPHEVIDAMLSLAEMTKDDIVHDLGWGDGPN
jgi:hypothetical protein